MGWDDCTLGGSSTGINGIPDVSWERVPSDEEASLPDSTGHCSDADTEPPAEEQWAEDPSWFATTDPQDYSGYAVSTSLPADNKAVLLECLKTTAVNVYNGRSSPAVVFFDSGSNYSYITMRLAQELQLPCLARRYIRVNTFGTDATTSISGFDTTVLLRSPHGATVAPTITASARVVPAITTAIIEPDEVTMLEKNECSLVSSRETPDLLIGQDLDYLLDRDFKPRLPNGSRLVKSCLGWMVGGAGTVANTRKTTPITSTATVSDSPGSANSAARTSSDPPSDANDAPPPATEQPPPIPPLGFNPEDPLNLWTIDDPAPGSANSAAPETETPTHALANSARVECEGELVIEASTHSCVRIEDNDADSSETFRA